MISLQKFFGRNKDKRITQQITEALCRTFVTPLEREDIEVLAEPLYKIPQARPVKWAWSGASSGPGYSRCR